MESITWHEAIDFCNKLSQRDNLKPYYQFSEGGKSGGAGYRLPTEAEWEYACRGGTSTRYSFGDNSESLGEYAWFSDNSANKTHPVGQKRPNAFGLYDMHGNVKEMCWDIYDREYYRQSPVVDPTGPSQGRMRVNRGGSWDEDVQASRSAARDWILPVSSNYRLGFRVARGLSDR